MLSKLADIISEQVCEGFTIIEYTCDEQVAKGFSCITYSNGTISALSPLEGNTSLNIQLERET